MPEDRCVELNPFWEFVARSAHESPTEPALAIVGADGQEQPAVTFADLRKLGEAASSHLHSLGASPGCIVFSAVTNTVASVALCIGVARCGATWAPADRELNAEQVFRLLRLYEPRVSVLSGGRAEAAKSLLERLGLRDRTAVLSQEAWEERLLRGCAPPLPPEAFVEKAAPILMLLTSGTTGMPKSIVTSNARIRSVLDAPFFVQFSRVDGRKQQKLIYFGSPSWISFSAVSLKAWEQRHMLVLGQRYAKAPYMDAVLRHEPGILFLWPEVLVDFVALPEETLRRVAGFARTMLYGGARTPPSALLRLIQALPETSFIQVYAASETMRISMLSAADHAAARDNPEDEVAVARLRSAGKCSATIRILTEDGRHAAVGEVGRIQKLFDPLYDFSTYYRNPEATAQKFTEDGWIDMGDLGSLDVDGYLYVEGRDAETIVLLSGDNVYPNDVENVLSELPGVAEVAVVKVVAGDSGGVEVGAFVRISPGSSLCEKDVRTHCDKRLGQAFTRPKHAFIREEKLPRNTNGKCLKSELTAEASRLLRRGDVKTCATTGGA